MKLRLGVLVLALMGWAGWVQAEEFSFDANEFEKKTFEFSGYLEQKEEALRLRSDRTGFPLAYPDKTRQGDLLRNTTTLELSGKLNLDSVVVDVRGQSLQAHDALVTTSTRGQIMEGGVRWSAGPGLTLDAGKRVLRWGKGYAWSPVGFVERTKDSSDPQASREGFVMASGEWTKSLNGPISTVGLSGLVVPTNANMNADFGNGSHLNPAGRLYLLALDTDIDLMWRGKGAKPASYGFDFSRNLTSALEIHGEWAHTSDAPRMTVTSQGQTRNQVASYASWLLGVRYLTQGEVTWIGEYYRNGNGYRADELGDYYQFLDTALAPGAASTLASRARTVAQSGYGRPNPGRDYLYVKASVSEPLGWVYGALSFAAMRNLNDRSWQWVPEVSYTGFNNVELRARLFVLTGHSHTEFGEKSLQNRLELSARIFF